MKLPSYTSDPVLRVIVFSIHVVAISCHDYECKMQTKMELNIVILAPSVCLEYSGLVSSDCLFASS